MTSLVEAATDLVNEVESADKGLGNAKISIVPFSDYVRIDTSYRDEDWIDVQPDHESTWEKVDLAASTNCRTVGSGETAYTECDVYVTTTKTKTLTWNGCMVSRPDGHHTTAAFDGNPFKGNAGHSYCDDDYNIMTALTDDFDQLESNIEALTPQGRTYLPVGLQWAWRTLAEAAFFTDETIDEVVPVQNVLLLMTDGSNTVSLGGGNGSGFDAVFHYGTNDEEEDRAIADELTLEMCASIKADGIRLITVAYEVPDNDTKNLLKSCASTNSDFYDAINASKLKQAFKKIGAGFNKARLTL